MTDENISAFERRIRNIMAADADTIKKVDMILFGTGEDIKPPLTISQTAKKLGKCRGTIHRWVRRGDLRVIRPGRGNPLVPHSEIERILGQ